MQEEDTVKAENEDINNAEVSQNIAAKKPEKAQDNYIPFVFNKKEASIYKKQIKNFGLKYNGETL